ncbi:oligosaccharide flippase family protein, partial [Colwellia sp. BRX8-8]|nr:oligosaccharide flippase family protein [Colwellia sp. BRX8-8]
FISQNFGAGNMHRVETSYKASTKFIMVLQLLIYFLLVLIAPFIADVFSKEQAVADIIVLFIWILPLGYGFQGVIILTNSSFNALHKPLVALVLSAIRLFVCYVPLAYLGSVYYGLEGFFIGGVFGNFIMAIISYRLFDKQFPHELTQAKDVS